MSQTTLSAKPSAAPPQTVEPLAPPRKRILLVEGDGFTRLVLLLRLRLAGFAVDFTSNGTLGLGKLRSCNPDVLLIELRLCGLSGLELIKAARAEPSFGDRPIYVFTHAHRIHRSTRKQIAPLITNLFDKNSVTREQLVQIFASLFPSVRPAGGSNGRADGFSEAFSAFTEMAPALEEIIAGVREQTKVLGEGKGMEARASHGAELLSRLCSLASCAEAARLPNLGRQARAVENFLNQLGEEKEGYTDGALSTVTRAVEVMSQIASDKSGKQQTLKRFSAVIFDEAPSSNRVTQEALKQAGFEPAGFADAGPAREYLVSNRADLIIINVLLPDAHGLSLPEIRRLPFHLRTPVIFGPESILKRPIGDDLPTHARRMDREPLLLSELIVKALNEVQNPNPAAPTRAQTAAPGPAQARQSFVPPSGPASMSLEDGFELFAAPAVAPSDPVAPAETPQPLRWSLTPQEMSVGQGFVKSAEAAAESELPTNNVLTAAMLRAQPDAAGADLEAEALDKLPETQTDGSQTDERPLEALAPSGLAQHPGAGAEPEVPGDDQAAAAAWLAPVAGQTGQIAAAQNSEVQQNPAAAADEPATALTQYEGEMNNQQATSTEYAPFGEGIEDQSGNGQASPRQDLAARICAAEMALHHAQGQIKRRDQSIDTLRQQLAEATAQQSKPQAYSAANPPAEQNVVQKMAQARCAELEQEVATLRQALEGLNGSSAQGQPNGEAETELRQQLEAANASSQQNEAVSQEAQARCAALEEQLTELREMRDDLANKLAEEQRHTAEAATRLAEMAAQPAAQAGMNGGPATDLELQVRQGVAALARVTAELAQERGQRQRSDQRAAELNARLQALHQDLSRTLQSQHDDLARISALEEQYRQAAQTLEQRTADLEQQQAERRLADEQLQKTKTLNEQLQKDSAFLEEANKKFEGARKDLESRLETSLSAARDAEARLQQEKAERQRLSEALDAIKRNAGDSSERDLEFSKLQSALQHEQVERKRQETQLAHIRHNALDSAQAAREVRTSLRRQVREPVDDLANSARTLLESELGEEQKKLVQAVLEDALLVQARLHESEPQAAEAAEEPEN